MTARIDGWESRLVTVIEDARRIPYALGRHDCFRMACADVLALTGVDRWPEFDGRYSTKREALALLARHGSTFEGAFDWFFGAASVPWLQARRGDVVELEADDGEKHLAVCIGSAVAGLRENGLQFFPLNAARCCWRVG